MPKKQKPPLVGVTVFAFRHDRVCKYTKGTGLCAGMREHGSLPALVSQIYFSSEITSHILGVYYPVEPIVATSFILHMSSTGVFMPFFAQSIIMFPMA